MRLFLLCLPGYKVSAATSSSAPSESSELAELVLELEVDEDKELAPASPHTTSPAQQLKDCKKAMGTGDPWEEKKEQGSLLGFVRGAPHLSQSSRYKHHDKADECKKNQR